MEKTSQVLIEGLWGLVIHHFEPVEHHRAIRGFPWAYQVTRMATLLPSAMISPWQYSASLVEEYNEPKVIHVPIAEAVRDVKHNR